MKNTVALALLATCLLACASNQPTGSTEVAENTTADAGSSPTTKRVCESEKSGGTGFRLKRRCRYEAVDKD